MVFFYVKIGKNKLLFFGIYFYWRRVLDLFLCENESYFDLFIFSDYKSDEDPKTYQSEKTGRGPLTTKTWKSEVEPVMTCYK